MFNVNAEEGRLISLALDDWGMSPGINEGILRLLLTGKVHSVSAMANLPYLSHGLEKLKSSGVEITFHLNLTLGKPIAPKSLVPTLCDSHGDFFGIGRFMFLFFAGRIRADEIALEAGMQLSRLNSEFEIPLGTLESHQNIHLIPGLLQTIETQLLSDGIVAIRTVKRRQLSPAYWATKYLDLVGAPAWTSWRHRPVQSLLARDFRTFEALDRRLKFAGNSVVVAHPALCDDLEGIGCPDPLRARRNQLDLLLQYLSES